LQEAGVGDDRIKAVWALLDEDYFIRHKSREIVWHTEWLADSDIESEIGLVDVRRQRDGDGVEAVLYTPRAHRTFAHATAVVDELGMTILDARIVPLQNEYSLDTFNFIELDGRIEIDDSRIDKIRRSLTRVLTASGDEVATVTRSLPRQARMFKTETVVDFIDSPAQGRTVMELVAADQPGLLSRIGQTFIKQGVDIQTAKIMTIGERAEDVFYLTDESGSPLDSDTQKCLRDELIRELDQSTANNGERK
jgi:[protein-PII] uridylyltransferase